MVKIHRSYREVVYARLYGHVQLRSTTGPRRSAVLVIVATVVKTTSNDIILLRNRDQTTRRRHGILVKGLYCAIGSFVVLHSGSLYSPFELLQRLQGFFSTPFRSIIKDLRVLNRNLIRNVLRSRSCKQYPLSGRNAGFFHVPFSNYSIYNCRVEISSTHKFLD